MLTEIINFYPAEYGIDKRAVKIINEKFDENLGVDEAGFIAMHIVNAKYNKIMRKEELILITIHLRRISRNIK